MQHYGVFKKWFYKGFRVSVVFGLCCQLAFGQLYINEFMASNSTTIADEMGAFSDWIEVYNASANDIDLAGYYFSDDPLNLTLWQIPSGSPSSVVVPAGGFLILWADGQPNLGFHHLDFKLSSAGEDVLLIAPDGLTILDQYTFGDQISDVSFGRIPDGGPKWDFFTQPTPGAANSTTPGGPQVWMPVANIRGGLYASAVEVSLSCATNGARIFYTTNGNHPTENSTEYTAPLSIDKHTTLRAMAFFDTLSPSDIMTETYLFGLNHTVPVVAYSADSLDLYDPATGMFSNFDQDISIVVNTEMYETDGSLAFNQQLESEIQGTGSAIFAQKSLALKAKSSLGSSTIDYQVFPLSGRDQYRSLTLRNSGNDWNVTMFRDAMATSLIWDLSDINGLRHTIEEPEIFGQAYRPVVAYINGAYWGLYNLRERSDWRYIKTHFGLDEQEIDLLRGFEEVKEGDWVAWRELQRFLGKNSLETSDDFQHIADHVDLGHYMDYVIFNLYIDNADWPGNNDRRFRKKAKDGKWHWLTYDLDFSFGLYVEGQDWNSGYNNANSLHRMLYHNGFNWPNPEYATLLFRRLMGNKKWRTDFVNRTADQLNLLFDDERVIERIDAFEQTYEPEMQMHADRWAMGFNNFAANIQILRDFTTDRAANVRNHFISEIADVTGISEIEIQINVPQYGEVELSTITVHEGNAPFSGIYFEGVHIPLAAYPAKGYVFDNWSGAIVGMQPETRIKINDNSSITANFSPGSQANHPLVINEINYRSSSYFDSGDWVELFNPNDYSVDISGWYLEDESGRFFGLAANTLIPAKGYLVLVEQASKFSATYPDVTNFLGDFGKGKRGFRLNKEGETISLYNAAGLLIDEVMYDDNSPWPAAGEQTGSTLQLAHANLDNSLAASWNALPPTPGQMNHMPTPSIDLELVNGMRVYPNPATSEIQIAIENSLQAKAIEVYGLGTQKILRMDASGRATNFQIDVADWHDGLYAIVLNLLDGRRIVKRLVVQHIP